MSGLKTAGIGVPARLTVVDVGGGSTEFAARQDSNGTPRYASAQIGAVRLTEKFLLDDPPAPEQIERCRQFVRARLRELPPDVRPGGAIVAVGGTATTAARMLDLTDDEAKQRIADIPAEDLVALLQATLAMPVSERKRLRGLPAQRADILPAGLMILVETSSAKVTCC